MIPKKLKLKAYYSTKTFLSYILLRIVNQSLLSWLAIIELLQHCPLRESIFYSSPATPKVAKKGLSKSPHTVISNKADNSYHSSLFTMLLN